MNEGSTLHFRSLVIRFKSGVLNFHRNFTTAHSTSATRTNFFIRTASERPEIHMKIYGYGECGLPPKKPGCYMSDMNDCNEFVSKLEKMIETHIASQNIHETSYENDILANLPEEICNSFKNVKSSLKNEITELLYLISFFKEEDFRAPKCALEFALFDLLTKYHQTTPTKLFFSDVPEEHESYSFYTASFEENERMVENIKLHLGKTKCIKIKYDNNIDKLLNLLHIISKEEFGNHIIVDANCSWTPERFEEFVHGIKKFQNAQEFMTKIKYIEQPFSFHIDDIEKWEKVKESSPIKILADESFRNELDIEKILRVAHAVNIKTEKTGGVLSTLKAAFESKKAGLEIMFGTMVSTQLGCTQTFQFYPLAHFLDVDGALLTKTPELKGGFIWGNEGKVIPFSEGFGLKVDASEIFM